MGVRTLLSSVKRDVTAKAMELWEEADGNLTMKLNGGKVVTAETNPLTGGIRKSTAGSRNVASDVGALLNKNTIVLIGDSITNQNYYNTGTAPSVQSYDPRGYFNWANALLGQRMTVINAAGVGGNKTQDVLDRLQRDVLSYYPAYCCVMIGVNDIFGNIPAATISSNLASIYEQLNAEGIVVIACTILPGTFTQDQRGVWESVNQSIIDYCRYNPSVILVDSVQALISSTDGAPVAGSTTDGIHPNIIGALSVGRAIAEFLDPIIQKVESISGSQTIIPQAKNVVRNGLMFGSNASGSNGTTLNAGFTGVGPDQWTATRSGTTAAVMSKVASSDWRQRAWWRAACTFGGANEKIILSPTDTSIRAWSSGGVPSVNDIVRPTVANGVAYRCITSGAMATGADPTAGWPVVIGTVFTSGSATFVVCDSIDVGDYYYAQCRVNLSSFSGGVLPSLEVWQYIAGYASIVKKTNHLTWDSISALPTTIPSGQLVLRTPAFQIDATAAIIHSQVVLFGAAGVTGNFDVTDFEVRKAVNAGAFSPVV